MDPVEQIFMQARAGSANGASMAADLTRAADFGLQKRRLADSEQAQRFSQDVTSRELAMQEQTFQQEQDVRAMAKNVLGGWGQQKTTEDRWKYIGGLAPLAVNPHGRVLLSTLSEVTDGLAKIEAGTLAKQVEAANVKDQARLAVDFPGMPYEDAKRFQNKNNSLNAALKEAVSLGLKPIGVSEELFDPSTGLMDPVKKAQWFSILPKAERLQTQENIADARIAAAQPLKDAQTALDLAKADALKEGRGLAPDATTKKIIESEKRGVTWTEDEINTAYKIAAGTMPRTAAIPSEAAFVDKHLNGLIKRDKELGIERKDSQRINYLQSLYGMTYGAGGKAKTAPVAGPPVIAQPKVKVIAPDGRTGSIPASQLEDALNQGYRKAE